MDNTNPIVNSAQVGTYYTTYKTGYTSDEWSSDMDEFSQEDYGPMCPTCDWMEATNPSCIDCRAVNEEDAIEYRQIHGFH